jgi:hypothetical protein
VRKKYFYVSLLMLVILGCQTIELLPEAKLVRTISPVVAEKCQHLGLVNAFEIYLGGGIEGAQLKIRNKAAKLGGNSILIVSENIDKHQHATIIAEVYKCSFENK